jgi:hypothetical protein
MPLDSKPPFYPGDTGTLTKAILQATEGANAGVQIEVYFNPKEITIDKQVPWQEHKNSEGDAPTLEFTAGKGKELSCELMFDMFEDKGDVYATYISQLENLALIDAELNHPPLSTFTWGSAGFGTFKGVLEDLNVKYTLFLPDGTPCRATVNIKMKQAETLMNKKEAEEANKAAAAQQKGTTPPAGQRPDQTAAAVGDPSYRDTCARNGVDDPHNPPAGQTYSGPPRGH